jgi:hypothetical protein
MEEYYKGIIISRYPDTNYAMVLNNPGYALEQEQNRKLAEKYYEETFELYRQGNDADVVSRAAYAMQTFDDQELLRRFAYIAVLAEGRNSDRETFRRELVSFAAQYPGTEMAEDALMIVAFIEREEPEIAQKAETETIAALYSFNNSVPHSFVYVLDGTANYNQLIFNIINFNLDNYDVPGIDAEMINFTPRQNFVVVKGFGDGAEAAE